jgi:hypothetical protein
MGKLFYGPQTGTIGGAAETNQQHLPDLIDEMEWIKPGDRINYVCTGKFNEVNTHGC